MRQRPRPVWLMPALAPRCPVHSTKVFRVLFCRVHPGRTLCSTRWVANGPTALAAHESERATHEALCSSGLYAAASL